jgi:hypothetical protein
MVMIDFCVMIHRDYPAAPPWNWSHGMPLGHRKHPRFLEILKSHGVQRGILIAGECKADVSGRSILAKPRPDMFFPSTWLINSPFTRHSSPHRGWSRTVERYYALLSLPNGPWAATWTPWTLDISIFKKLTLERTAQVLGTSLCVIFGPLSLRYTIYTPWAIHKVPPLPTRFLEFLGFGLHVFQHLRLRRGDLFIFWSHRMSRSNCYVSKANGVYHPQNHLKIMVV